MAIIAAQLTPAVVSTHLNNPARPRISTSCLSHSNRCSPTFVASKELPHGLNANRLPRHVAVIMDGNARWAKEMGLPQAAGYEMGFETLMKIIWLSCTWGLKAFTPFLFSTENWNRSKANFDLEFYMQLMESIFVENLEDFMRYNVQTRVIGDVRQLPGSLQSAIRKTEENTRQNSGLKLSLAINYGGRCDIIRACQQIAKKVKQEEVEIKDISDKLIEKELWTNWLEDDQNPDLIIRTSGEERLSNFLLWQSAYSEISFVDALWPAFDESLYLQTLVSFQSRQRRFGK